MKKQNIAIVAVVAFVLAVAVGYALFRETITINGTATAKGNFDVEIMSAEVADQKASTGATAVVATDKNSLTIAAPDLQYPGAYVEYDVVLKNVGSIDAVLKNITETGKDVAAPIKVTYFEDGLPVQGSTLAANATAKFTIRVEWLSGDDEDEEADGTIDNAVNVPVSYNIVFDYEQVTVQ